MTTPINTLEDILEALERDPALREALRRHILTDELLQMPVRLQRIETDVSTLKDNLSSLTTTVNRIEDNVSTLTTTVNKMGGDVSMLKGSDYESHVARLASRFLHRQLGIAATVFSSQRNQAALATLLDDAEKQGTIDADETDELDKTDLILTADGPTDYILAEISITIQQHDVDRAAHRAALLAKATGQDRDTLCLRRPGGTRPQPPRRPDHAHTRTHRRLNPAGGNSGNQSLQNAI